MADRNEAESADESSPAARPEQPNDVEQPDDVERPDDVEQPADVERPDDAGQPGDVDATGSDPSDDEDLEQHVAPDDAREPTVAELEQLLEGDDDTPSDAVDSGVSDHDSDEDDSDDDDNGDDTDLVSVGAVPTGRSRTARDGAEAGSAGSAAARTSAKARGKKDKATPRQKKDVEKRKRTTPVSFTREAVGELRKVVYPTAPQLGNYFVVVLVFVLIIIGFVGLLDLGFGWVIVKIFG